MFKRFVSGLAALSLPVVSMAAPLTIDVADATGTVSNGATAAISLAVAVLALVVGVRIYRRISSAA
jgi:glutamate/tyrosine decarboxylase-like PLP-dependent enzyme